MWYEKSANQGNMCGTFNLGLMYEEGKGTYPDQEKAFK